MPLSEYERRVLYEIEAQLTARGLKRVVPAERRTTLLAATVAVLAVGLIVLLALLTPAVVAAPLGGLAGGVAGFLISSSWLRRRGRTAGR